MCLLILNLKLFRRTGQRKAFNRYIIPEFNCERKESVKMGILTKSRNGERKIIQFLTFIRITSGE